MTYTERFTAICNRVSVILCGCGYDWHAHSFHDNGRGVIDFVAVHWVGENEYTIKQSWNADCVFDIEEQVSVHVDYWLKKLARHRADVLY